MAEESWSVQIAKCFARVDGLIDSLLTDPDDKLPPEVFREAKLAAVRHHSAHFRVLPVRQTSVCPYKILSWYAFALSARATEQGKDPTKKILRAAIAAMAHFLRIEGRHLPGTAAALLLAMASNHRRPDMEDFAIGANGLYASFFSAKSARHFIPSSPR